MRIFGITGTNGKTTTSWILREFLGGGGLITTVEVDTGCRRFSSGYTTPPLKVLKEIFAEMEANGLANCVMEVSSHAIHQHRTGDTVFAGCAFTNLTEDHLDYHKTMEAYFEAKVDLFRQLAESNPGAPAAICVDGDYGRRLAAICHQLPLKTIECGLSVSDPQLVSDIQERCPLVGRYNVQNVLLAATLAKAVGVPMERIQAVIPTLHPRWGRLERVETLCAAEVFVDYAHTDDALANVLSTVKEFTKGRLWVVFGAGGNRDARKRPLMGSAAARFADRLVITSDNPRGERPMDIINQIVAGIPSDAHYDIEPDRRKAIFWTLERARSGDVVVICGKGHETTQTIGEQVIHFDDREVCGEFGKVSAGGEVSV